MGMTAFEDDDEALTEDKPFSPMYPIFNFVGQNSNDQPPAYGFAAPEYEDRKI